MNYLIVFVGGGLGAAARHGVNVTAARLVGIAFPYGTLFINVTGFFVMGVIGDYFALKGQASQRFGCSSQPAFLAATRPLVASVVLSIGALFAGLAIVRAIV